MKQVVQFFLLLLSPLCMTAQSDSAKETRQVLIGQVADVLFEREGKLIRAQTQRFEDLTSIKLGYKVNSATLDQLGGLSEYLLKIYQSITNPVRVHTQSLLGEFSAHPEFAQHPYLQYETRATHDLSDCLFPPEQLANKDSVFNSILAARELGNALDSLAASHLLSFLVGTRQQYTLMFDSNKAGCGVDSVTLNRYNSHVAHTAAIRTQTWSALVQQLSGRIEAQELLHGFGTTPLPQGVEAHYIINSNLAFDKCSEEEQEANCQLLYKETGIRFYFMAADIPFFLPLDSVQVFADEIAANTFSKAGAEKYVLAFWLKCNDGSDYARTPRLVIAQNTDALTKADIEFARTNTGNHYENGALYVFQDIYRHLPKPLYICYQVAKANGLLSTTLSKKKGMVKGQSCIYQHIFKLDKTLFEIEDLAARLQGYQNIDPKDYPAKLEKVRLEQELHALKYSVANTNQLQTAPQHFRATVLNNSKVAELAALEWLAKKFPHTYGTESTKEKLDAEGFALNFVSGVCDRKESDVMEEGLMYASLLLSAVDLDFIPDALSVWYCIDKGDYIQATNNLFSLFTPGNINAYKRLLKAGENPYTLINYGSKIVREGDVLKVIDAEQEALLKTYRISSQAATDLPQRISNQLELARKLLPGSKSADALLSAVNDLPETKRLEFLEHCLNAPAFAEQCLKNTDVLWKWANRLSPQMVVEWAEVATKQNNSTKVMLGLYDGGGANSYISKAGTTHTYFSFDEKWSDLVRQVNGSQEEIWKINMQFILNQKHLGKEFWFSHNPFSPNNGQYFALEVNFLIDLGVQKFEPIDGLWKAIW